MRSNGNNSKCGNGNSSGCRATAETAGSGHGPNGSGGNASSNEQATETENWFQPIGSDLSEVEITDCPGGICPVPWATEITESQSEAERLVQLTDNVNHPSHYTKGGIECIEAIEAQLTPEEYRGYLKGNVAKYMWREKYKGGTESLEKAQWYLQRLIELK